MTQDRRVVVDVQADPRVHAAKRIAEEVLAPAAAEVDRTEVPLSHLRTIADAGLLGLNGPVEAGGSAAPRPVFRAVAETLAGADCATWFVQAQHHTPLAMLAQSDAPVRDRLLRPLSTGRLLAGIAFAHLRRFVDRPVTVTRVPGGWRFDGTAPWYSGWGLNDVMLLGGINDADEVVSGCIDARPRSGLAASAPLRMVAMQATRTVRLHLDGLTISDADVITRMPFQTWAQADRQTTANVNPATFGVTATALRLLRATGDRDAEPAALRCAVRLEERMHAIRERSYWLLDEVPPAERLAERLAARAEALAVMNAATSALVVAGAGRSMSADAPAQRLARESLFLLIQAQTAEVRRASLDRWSAFADRA